MTSDATGEAAGPAERRLVGVALNPAAPADVLLRLLASESAAVRMALCRDRVLLDPVVNAVEAHPDPYTRSLSAAVGRVRRRGPCGRVSERRPSSPC
ncbi:hypothetical protein [Streptomyces sp. NPDC048428]|uniref:hypothetical protein n=1 Tax=Streptomyces sp. NPDC048428 TaxID=3154503 RepID=UPI003436AB4E